MYRLFYNHETLGDTLMILLDPESPSNSFKKEGNIAYCYYNDKLVGINIFDIGKVMKIHAEGMIPAPKKEMIDVINSLLASKGIKLPYCESSFYKVAEVKKIEDHPLDEKSSILTLSLKDREIKTVTRYRNLVIGEKVVVAIEGCIKFDGVTFHEKTVRNIPIQAELCSASDLKLGDEDKAAFKADKSEVGEDFFLGGF